MISRLTTGLSLTLLVASAAIAQVRNDECTGAIVVVPNATSSLLLNTFGATHSGVGPSCAPTTTGDVWHTFTSPIDGFALVLTSASFGNEYSAVFDACGGTELACSLVDGDLRLPVLGGQSYFVLTTSTLPSSGRIRVFVEADSPNADCANAAPLTVDADSSSVPLYTTTATSGPPVCGQNIAVELFYDFTVPATGLYEIRSRSLGDALIELKTGCAGSTVECIDNVGLPVVSTALDSRTESWTFRAQAGESFVVRVASTVDASSASVSVGTWTGDFAGRHVIVQAERTAATNSTRALRRALVASGYNDDSIVFVQPSVLQNPPTGLGVPLWVWVLCGTFPQDFDLETEAPGLAATVHDWVLAGSHLYLSGGDNWTLNDIGVLADIDGVGNSTATPGDDSHTGMIGSDITAGLDNVYRQEQPGDDSIDQILPADGVLDLADSLGANSVPIWTDDGSGNAATAYTTGVFYRTAPPTSGAPQPGFVFSTSTEFGGHFDGVEFEQTAVLAAYAAAISEGQPRFIRGDADQNGILNLNDVILIVTGLFSDPAPYPNCIDTVDLTADSVLSLADPIYLLRAAFAGGPLPPAPFPDCGPALVGAVSVGCSGSNSNCAP